jgi:hypothetical protein
MISTAVSGAESVVTGVVSAHASWREDLYFFSPDGTPMDLAGLDFEFQFRDSQCSSGSNVVLSIDEGSLSIEEDEGSVASILRIDAEPGKFSAYAGDMTADLVSVDIDGNVLHRAHGVVTFTNDPVAI